MISCQRAAAWTSRELDAALNPAARSLLGFHRLVCGNCRRYGRQLAEVDAAVAGFLADGLPEPARLPGEARERITRALRDASGG